MSKKALLTIITLFFLIGMGFIVYSIFKPSQTPNTEIPDSEVQNPFGNFFPSENVPVNQPPTQSPDSVPTINIDVPIKKLRQLAAVPIAGSTVFKSASSTDATPIFRYVERATGHVYELTTTDTVASRISNTTIPKIYEAFFLEDKNQIVFRYLNSEEKIDTYVATIRATTTESGEIKTTLNGVFIQKDITTMTVSPNGKSMFLLSPNTNTASVSSQIGQVALSISPNKQNTVFTSPISVWNAEWLGDALISVATKPSHIAQGILYFINAQTGAQEKILGPINGLSTKSSPNNKKVLYSKNDRGNIVLNFLTLPSDIIKTIPISTLAEKCVWSKNNKDVYCAVPNTALTGQYPDTWYMGLVSFNDSLVKIDTEAETVRTIMSVGAQTTESLDMINLQLSPKEDYLMFTNKRDLTLWSLDIKE